MPNQVELIPSIDEKFQIKIYGKKVNDIVVDTKKSSLLNADAKAKLILVKVYGAKIAGDCIKFPLPFYTFLPDNGTEPDGCGDLGNADEYLMWTLLKDHNFVNVSLTTGSLEEVIKGGVGVRLNVDSDFRIHDVVVSGTKVSAKLRAYLRLRQPGPFGDLFNIVVVDADYSFSVDLAPDTCVTVFSIGIASAQVCFRADPNRICGEVSVGIDLPIIGHWGQSFTIACVNL